MDVVWREEVFLRRAIRSHKIVGDVEYVNLRVAIQLELIDGRIGLQNVFVEAIAWRVRGQDLHGDHFCFRKPIANRTSVGSDPVYCF